VLEPPRTNELLRSQVVTAGWANVDTPTITGGGTTAPDGSAADTINDTSAVVAQGVSQSLGVANRTMKIWVKVTPKEHSEYRDVKQTVVSRLSVMTEDEIAKLNKPKRAKKVKVAA
jgi:hypothetical protein